VRILGDPFIESFATCKGFDLAVARDYHFRSTWEFLA
jgi:hypothetical protein